MAVQATQGSGALGETQGGGALAGMQTEALAALARARQQKAIDKVGTDFESMFLSLLLKEMRQTLEPGSLFAGDSGDIWGGLFDLYLGQHLAQGGALGIGAMVRNQLNSLKTK